MIVGWHSIFTMYGFWLPNDPRGSGSDYVGAWELLRYGSPTKRISDVSSASMSHDHAQRIAAKESLRYPPVEISGTQALAVAAGFRKACEEANYSIHACAILPDHVHLVVAPHRRRIRRVIGHLKSHATRQLKEQGLWLVDERPVWGEHGWNIMLEDEEDLFRSINYVEQNPVKEGKKPQRWSFVVPIDFQALRVAHDEETEPRRRIGGAALWSQTLKRERESQRRIGDDPQ